MCIRDRFIAYYLLEKTQMGIYVNPGNEEFKRAVNSKIYVDKTMLLAFTNQNLKSEHQNICAVSYTHLDVYKRQIPHCALVTY